jgi:hypothetical protein
MQHIPSRVLCLEINYFKYRYFIEAAKYLVSQFVNYNTREGDNGD